MTLNSGVILLNYRKNEVYAGRIPRPDSVGFWSKAGFTQGRDEINPDSIRFNFDTKKALMEFENSTSDMNIFKLHQKRMIHFII